MVHNIVQKNVAELKKQKPFKRGHGFLMPVFSLDGNFGIGTMGKSCTEFIDFVSAAGGYMWQVLPFGPIGYSNSPYQCFSAFAGNPYLIDPELLYEEGLLGYDDTENLKSENTGRIDYGYLYNTRKKALYKAFQTFKDKQLNEQDDYNAFLKKASFWLEDYAVFMAIKSHFGNIGRENFKDYKIKTESAVRFVKENLTDEASFIKFLEYEFWHQWKKIKVYASKKNILLVGDIPLYVSNDSADVFAHPELFKLSNDYSPSAVAGVPPDIFSKKGQLWGNPLYNWAAHRENNFKWWSDRIKWQNELFDIIRIDHFIGFSRYYSIDSENKTAENGIWLDGPGIDIIKGIQQKNPNALFIAEDLGLIDKKTEKLLKATGFPGMSIFEFAFDSDSNNKNLPHNIKRNTVSYIGTHDNMTLKGFTESVSPKILKKIENYVGCKNLNDLDNLIIRECFKSQANTLIISLADYMGLDNSARINTPATSNGNWEWRAVNPPYTEIAEKVLNLSKIYGRENKNATNRKL